MEEKLSESAVVRDLMTPISDFSVISEEATFVEAVLALEKAQEDFLAGRGRQRILLVRDKQGKVLGKLSPLDVVRGLEPEYEKILDSQKRSMAREVDYVITSMRHQAMLWAKPFDDLCLTAQDAKVGKFYNRPTERQTVKAEDSLNLAFHRFVLGRHDSLFVTEQGFLVGMLRFSDVYREIARRIKEVCKLRPA